MDKKFVANELILVAKDLVAISEWDSWERQIGERKLMDVTREYRDLLFEMMQAGEIDRREYSKASSQMFKDVDRLRNNMQKYTRR